MKSTGSFPLYPSLSIVSATTYGSDFGFVLDFRISAVYLKQRLVQIYKLKPIHGKNSFPPPA